MNKDEINIKIDDFLKGKLSDAEVEAFHQEMEEDAELAAQVERYRLEHEVMNELVGMDLLQKMKQWDIELEKSPENSSKSEKIRPIWRRPRILRLAAAVAIILVALIWFFINGVPKEETIATNSGSTFKVPLLERGEGGLGLSGNQKMIDSISITLVSDTRYPFHYRFKDQLEVYTDQDQEDLEPIKMEYDPSADLYILELNGESFQLERGFNKIFRTSSDESMKGVFPLIGLSFYLVFFHSSLTAQNLDEQSEAYRKTFAIYKRVVRAAGRSRPAPKLVMLSDNGRPSGWNGAGFKAQPLPTIYLEEKLFNLCRELGDWQADAIALILGHELAHFYQKHQISTGFADPGTKHRVAIEAEADYYGAYYGGLAGYRTIEVFERTINLVYEGYHLPEINLGYPAKKERFQLVNKAFSELSELIPTFKVGQLLFLMKEYEAATSCFNYISSSFPSREIFNNIGVCYLAQALEYTGKNDRFYAFPFEIDVETRLKGLIGRSSHSQNEERFNSLLDKAWEHFDQARSLDPTYFSAYINMACVEVLQDHPKIALGTLEKLKIQQPLTANALQIRAIAHDKLGHMEKARRDFRKADALGSTQAAYNLGLFEGRQLNQSNSPLQYIREKVGQLLASLWTEELDVCRPEKELGLDQFSFIDLLELNDAQLNFKIPESAIKFHKFAQQGNNGLYIRFAGEYKDKELFFLHTGNQYQGKTQNGLRIGSSPAEVVASYCEPDYQISASNEIDFYIYADLQMIIRLEENQFRVGICSENRGFLFHFSQNFPLRLDNSHGTWSPSDFSSTWIRVNLNTSSMD